MKLNVMIIGVILLSGASCHGMDAPTKPEFLNTECQMPTKEVIIQRLTNNTVLTEQDTETYNLAHVLGGKKEFVFEVENRVVAALTRHYRALALQEVGTLSGVQGLADYYKKEVLTVILKDYPGIVQEFQKLWAQESPKK